ncbi:MAG TPA: hypothetical protein VL991_04405 [Terracidiphilus sp.]|jgi:hypothetical protein|nr:hypothetical protein [Terracidiphilus sp.]
MEPVNHWRPVTTEYQQELPAITLEPSSFGHRAMWAAKESAAAPLPAGITCVAWFYVLAAGFYFAFGSILLADPSSDLAAAVVAYFRIVLPLPLGIGAGVPLDNLLAEIFFVLAMISASIGVMWMARFRPVRWLTLSCAGAELVRCAYCFLHGQGAVLTPLQTRIWLAVSAIDLMIFCYVAFYAGVERVFGE